MNITVRPMRREEIGIAMDMAAQEGWNPGLHDAASFYAADPQGFLLAEAGGEVVGCISAVSYGGQFGFIGLFIVSPGWRGRGVGSLLWKAGMARLSGQVTGLDGVPAQQDYYRSKGFELAWNNARFAGAAPAGKPPCHDELVPLREVNFAALCAYDRQTFPAPREAFLRAWIDAPDARGLAWMDTGHIAGWGLVRQCREGYKIGPLVADNTAIAHALYAALCAQLAQGSTVYLDIPLPNAEALALARAQGLQVVFETARMFCGTAPAIALQRVYGITSFELG